MSIFRDEIFGMFSPSLLIRLMRPSKWPMIQIMVLRRQYGRNVDTALQATRQIKEPVSLTQPCQSELPLGGFKQSGWGRGWYLWC